MSQTTIVNTLPIILRERKPGLVPSYFEVPAAPKGGISTLVIEDAFYLMLIPMADDKVPPVRVPVVSENVARSIIEDYLGANVAVDMTVMDDGRQAIPGVFALPGDLSAAFVTAKHADLVKKHIGNTRAWFERLVKMGDDEWFSTHQHRGITDTQRVAVNFLGLEREWGNTVFDVPNAVCPACKSNINPEAILCPNCKVIINAEKYKQFAFAGK